MKTSKNIPAEHFKKNRTLRARWGAAWRSVVSGVSWPFTSAPIPIRGLWVSREKRILNTARNWISLRRFLTIAFASLALCISAHAAASDGFDYPIGPPSATPRCPGTDQCPGGWQNVQRFRANNHLGEDWNFGSGDDDFGANVYAAANGEVVYAQDVGGDHSWNGVIIILHTGSVFNVPGGGQVTQVKSLYGHLDTNKINNWVRKGSMVTRGQKIGGSSTVFVG